MALILQLICMLYIQSLYGCNTGHLHFEGLTKTPFNMNGCTSNQAVQFVILIPDKSQYVNFSPKRPKIKDINTFAHIILTPAHLYTHSF